MIVLVIVILVANSIYLQLQLDSVKAVLRAMIKAMEDDE